MGPTGATLSCVDSLQAHDRDEAQRLSPSEKLAQALEMMRVGIIMKRSLVRRRFPEAAEADIERLLDAWLMDDG